MTTYFSDVERKSALKDDVLLNSQSAPPPPIAGDTATGCESEEGRHPVHIEVQLSGDVMLNVDHARNCVLEAVKEQTTVLHNGPLDGQISLNDPDVESAVVKMRVCGVPPGGLSFFQADITVHAYQLSSFGPEEEVSGSGNEQATLFQQWTLPAREFDSLWDSLVFEEPVKEDLLDYVATSMLFADAAIDQGIITWNHVVLLHGPPGTGKTSLCKALAHKAAIRLDREFSNFVLLEVNAHSLFSKWFSESGKLVGRLFECIHDLVEDADTMVLILIDEVESLAAVRNNGGSGTEPSDAIRVVNALLTQLDQLKASRNAFVLTTSNLSGAIDVAFVDRADIKLFLGPPGMRARVRILASCVHELMRTGLIRDKHNIIGLLSAGLDHSETDMEDSETNPMGMVGAQRNAVHAVLKQVGQQTDGWSGRRLRKLPFQAHAKYIKRARFTLEQFLTAMFRCVNEDQRSEGP